MTDTDIHSALGWLSSALATEAPGFLAREIERAEKFGCDHVAAGLRRIKAINDRAMA